MNIQQLQNLTLQYRAELWPRIYNFWAGQVQTGPFTGMQLLPDVCWGDGDTASKVMGLYENELHTAILAACSMQPDLVINIGSAEGYYAVGAARATGAKTIAADIDARAQAITAATARANSVAVTVTGELDAAGIEHHLQSAVRPWIIMDCEGAEQHLLDPVAVPSLQRSMILVESHDCFVPDITATLSQRFQATHNCTVIRAQGKDPWIFPELDALSDLEKLILVNECRPSTAFWIWMTPR